VKASPTPTASTQTDATGEAHVAASLRVRQPRFLVEALGLGWVLLAGLLAMAPALVHGIHLGSYDFLTTTPGLATSSVPVRHYPIPIDQITEFIPWTLLDWTQVHHGHLPLWNQYSALGTPLAFNWQAGTFSPMSVVGYLVPQDLAYTASVLATLFVAGSGAYLLGRVLGLGVIASAMAGTVFELSGSFMAWLGWPIAAVMAWTGWLLAAVILVTRQRRRARHVAFLAVVSAFAVYAGQLDTLVLLAVTTLVFAVVLLAVLRIREGPRRIGKPLLDLGLGALAGACLAAPLALPGLQLAVSSVRTRDIQNLQLPPHTAVNLAFQGFDGFPWLGSQWFGPSNYFESAAYVGIVALALALVGVAIRRRRAEVIALSVLTVVMAGIVFVPALVGVLGHLPYGTRVQWHRALVPLDFGLAMLAGVGTDALIRRGSWRQAARLLAIVLWGFSALLLVLWVVARGTLPPVMAHVRATSFVWPLVAAVVGGAVVSALRWGGRRPVQDTPAPTGNDTSPTRRGVWAAAVLLAMESVFLITAGAPLWSSSPRPLTPTPAEAQLRRLTHGALVGYGTHNCWDLGILQEVNAPLGVPEFAAYDPMLPRAYMTSWSAVAGTSAGPPVASYLPRSEFCPAIQSVAQARLYGVQYLLEPAGTNPPSGTIFEARVGNEGLYRVPGASRATLSPLRPDGTFPNTNAPATSAPVTQPTPGSWSVVTRAVLPSVLRLRLTAVPGWHGTIDGRPLPLEKFSGVMLQARIPPGRHTVVLRYWPGAFTAGLLLAAASAVALALALVASRRHRSGKPDGPGSSPIA
jgi:hypothetical protein